MIVKLPPILPQKCGIHLRTFLFALLFFLMSACGAGGKPPSEGLPTPKASITPKGTALPTAPPKASPTPESTATPRVAVSALEGVQVPLWHLLPDKWLRGPVARFNRENPWGIEVVPRAFPDEAALTDALPEASPGTVLLGYPRWESPDNLSDLTPWLNDPHYGMPAEEQADFFETFWDEGWEGETLLTLPLLRSAAFLARNHTWAAELGYPAIPQDVSAFQAQACAANAALRGDDDVYNDGLGGWVVDTRPPVMLGWLYAFGAPLTADGTYRFDTPEGETAFGFLKALFDENCAWVGEEAYPDAYFSARQALFVSATLSDLPFLEQAFAEAGSRDHWGALPFPSAPGEEPALPTFGPSFGMLRGADEAHSLAGWLFMRWMLSPDVLADLARQSGYLPVRRAALDALADYGALHPAWQAVAEALPYARPEPSLPSWSAVQWVLQDAGEQVFRSYFTADRITETLQLLEETANSLAAP